MPRSLLYRLPLILLLAAPSLSVAEVSKLLASNSVYQPDISSLIAHLSDPDASSRKNACDHLLSLCETASPQMMLAMDSARPEVRVQLSDILIHRTWILPSDPDTIKVLLAPYPGLDADSRCQLVAKLATELPPADTTEPLLRILKFDPNSTVRWTAAQVLRTTNTKPFQDQLRALSTDSTNPLLIANAPLLTACGWVWRENDVHRTTELLTRAIEIEARRPSAMNGQLAFAYLWLIENNINTANYSGALRLLRDQAFRTPWDETYLPAPVASLIAFHAEYGPFPGFVTDLQTYRSYLNHPELLYALARLADRRQWPSASLMLSAIALADSGFSPESHCTVAAFLTDQGWTSVATRELRVALWLSDDAQAANVYFLRARIAEQAGDEFAIASNLESAVKRATGGLQRTLRTGEVLPWADADAWAEVQWHYLRAAQAGNDVAAMHLRLEKLMELDRLSQILQKDPSLATDIVPALNQTGQTEDGRKVFDATYQSLKEKVTADPADSEAKNNLAWLCARCDQNLDEAAKLADEAVATAPDNSAYLDTAAESHYRAGDQPKAIALETKALQLKPNDSFMKEQLKRFQTKTNTNR